MRILLIWLLLLGAGSLFAQPFQLRVARDGNVFGVLTNGNVDMPAAAVGLESRIDVTAVYSGTKSVAILKTELFGKADFTASQTGTPTLLPGVSYTFTVRYKASTSALSQALIMVTYLEEGNTPGSFVLNLTGTSPQIAMSYSLAADNSSRPLPDGATIALPASLLGSPVDAAISLANAGSGPGVVTRIALSGPPSAQLVDLPILPVTIPAGQTQRFTVRITPLAAGTIAATVQIDAPGGTIGFAVSASGFANRLNYSLVDSSGTVTPLAGGATISFPDTIVGARSPLRIRISNSSPAPIAVGAVSLDTTTEFQVATIVTQPWVIPAGGTSDLTVAFVPTRAQASSAALHLGTDSFLLTGTGLSGTLSFRYTTAQGDVAVDPNGTIALPATPVGGTGATEIVVRNLTAQAVAIARIGVTDAQSAFRLGSLPPLPWTVGAQQEVRIPLTFAPPTAGTLAGTIAVDSNIFFLRGVASAPSKLPVLTIQVPAGSGGALQQIGVSAALGEAYSVDLVGTLALSFDSTSFAVDPAVQFSTGGRNVAFRIPAGTLKAIISSGSTTVFLQTGSVAGDIQVAATVQTAAQLDLTPAGGSAVHIRVAETAPVVFGLNVIASSSGVYQLQILGMSDIRAINQVHIQFTPTGKVPFASTDFKLNIKETAAAWFRSTTSQDFGGLFSVLIPLAVTLPNPDPTKPTLLSDLIQSIAVDVSSDLGTSPAVTLSLR